MIYFRDPFVWILGRLQSPRLHWMRFVMATRLGVVMCHPASAQTRVNLNISVMHRRRTRSCGLTKRYVLFFPYFDFSVDADFNVFYASDEDVGTLAITVRSDPPSTSWPSDTNLVYADGNKVKLMLQHALVKLVIQEAFDDFKAAILFTHAFPDAKLSLTFARDALISGAKRHLPATQDILTRVSRDDEYISKINTLVRAYIEIYGLN